MRELYVDRTGLETRVALVEQGQLVELWIERATEQRLVGGIFKGIVRKVLPGLAAAFVDIGAEQDGFLPFGDAQDRSFNDAGSDLLEAVAEAPAAEHRIRRQPVKQGQELLVQVTKEPIASKGCRVTTYISLAGRYCVLLADEDSIGVSQRIASAEERSRLKDEFRKALPKGCGAVVRTAAEGQDRKVLLQDLKQLVGKWQEIQRQAKKVKAPGVLHSEPAQVFNVLRDVAAYGIDQIVVDDKETFKDIQQHLGDIDPGWRKKLQLAKGDQPLFLKHDLEKQIGQAMQRELWLKSGGRISIEQTEAMTTIDVNSGRYVGKRAAEETIFKVNLEAAAEVARQIRLRDIGGIIVIDFIDMESRQKRAKVLEALKQAMAEDRSKPVIYDFSPLGLVEMNRKRTKPSLWHTVSETCPDCRGTGRRLGPSAVAARIVRWLLRSRRKVRGRQLELVTNPVLADFIEGQAQAVFRTLTKELDCKLYMEEDPDLPMEKFILKDRRTGQTVEQEDFSIDSPEVFA